MSELRFSSVRASRKVVLEDADGNEVIYNLREMTGKEAAHYRNDVSKRFGQPDKDGNITTRNFDGMYQELLKRCLYDADGVLVSAEVLDDWRDVLLQSLYEAAMELNGMGEKDEPKKS